MSVAERTGASRWSDTAFSHITQIYTIAFEPALDPNHARYH